MKRIRKSISVKDTDLKAKENFAIIELYCELSGCTFSTIVTQALDQWITNNQQLIKRYQN